MNEIWKDIPEFKGQYQASNLGNIKRIEHKTFDGRLLKEQLLKTQISNAGYVQV